jgi:hypothetical protein
LPCRESRAADQDAHDAQLDHLVIDRAALRELVDEQTAVAGFDIVVRISGG